MASSAAAAARRARRRWMSMRVCRAAPAKGRVILERLHVREVETRHYAHLARPVMYDARGSSSP